MEDLVYKYRDYNERALEIIIKRELWLAEPQTLNDPFDCQTEYSEILINAINALTLSEEEIIFYRDAASKIIKRLRILSLSSQNNNPLLWAHYSNSHKGFCLEFDYMQFEGVYNPALRPQVVNYESQMPKLSLPQELINMCNSNNVKWEEELGKHLDKCVYELALTKPKEWEYEKELRVITIHPKQGKVIKFDHDALRAVYFGLNMPTSQQSTVMQLLSSNEWKHVKFYQMEKEAGSFKLIPKLISKSDVQCKEPNSLHVLFSMGKKDLSNMKK